MSATLRLEGVVAGYGRGDILCGIDLTVEARSVMCLVGPNGAGKSTVLKTVSALLRPREGRILLDGVDISRLSVTSGNQAAMPSARLRTSERSRRM